nr:unnamed protein product [Callosobruchus chinensis]
MFLPDSDEELTGGTDVSELGESCNQQKFKNKRRHLRSGDFYRKNTKKTKTDQDVLSQPCCSKSLSVETGKTPHIFPEDSNVGSTLVENEIIPESELNEFFEVEIPQENETAPEHNPEPQNKEEDHEDRHPENTWKSPTGSHQVFEYSSESGLHASYAALLINDLSPYNCFRAFIDDKIIEAMEDQTNLYASQVLCDAEDISRESRLHQWTPTSKAEMIKFIGIIAYMGLVRLASIDRYWRNDILYRNFIVSEIMPRNRFQLLLRMWHFSDNKSCPEGDRLYKVKPLLEKIIKNFQSVYTPGRTYCIDESIVPFQGRLVMKQYIPRKTHKYGVKLFKLCSENGYTWNIRIYAGKESNEYGSSVATNVVIKLSEGLLNSGRTIVADNYYTSLELANILLDKQTHYIGTLRSNRRGNPREVIEKKLKKGEVFGLENERGICILKWKDKRDVLLWSTKHSTETVEIQRRTGAIQKPQAVVDYNEAKSSIDQSDQMTSYNAPLRKSLK